VGQIQEAQGPQRISLHAAFAAGDTGNTTHCDYERKQLTVGRNLFEQLEPFRVYGVFERDKSSGRATRRRQAFDKAGADGVDHSQRTLSALCGSPAAMPSLWCWYCQGSPARYISISASSTELSRRRQRSMMAVSNVWSVCSAEITDYKMLHAISTV
jgi:hypothetical protein